MLVLIVLIVFIFYHQSSSVATSPIERGLVTTILDFFNTLLGGLFDKTNNNYRDLSFINVTECILDGNAPEEARLILERMRSFSIGENPTA